MDARAILEKLLQSGRELAEQSKEAAEQHLGVPEKGPERETMLAGMGKGAAAAGALALLLGTGAGRRLTGSALKLGSLAAVGGLAYKAYQDWQGKQSGRLESPGTPAGELNGNEAQDRSVTLLKAMIAAAKADGHVDDAERQKISEHIQQQGFDSEFLKFLGEELEKPLDAKQIADSVDSPEAAAEVYLASLLVIDVESQQEKTYLENLASQLKLAPELVENLQKQAQD